MKEIAPIIAALIAAFIGSWVGAQLALSRYRKERAFDRQLDWYERMTRAQHQMAQKIEIASTWQSEEDTDADLLKKVWRDVQRAHLLLENVAFEADLYGSSKASKMARQIVEVVEHVADETDAFDPSCWKAKDAKKLLGKINELPDQLRKSVKPIALEARRHLGLTNRFLLMR